MNAIAAPPVLADWAHGRHLQLNLRRDFCEAVALAVERCEGFAAGKLGVTEKALLYHPLLLERERERRRIVAFERTLAFKAGRQSGVFPVDTDFLRRFSPWYATQVGELDAIGLMPNDTWTLTELFDFYRFTARVMHYKVQEPDRSPPDTERWCYLPAFRDRKLLLISPFAALLRSRAQPELFEAVWSKIEKPWFYPASVDALELPYGFDEATRRRYASTLELFEELAGRLEQRQFDVALIGAGALGIPLAALLKRRGKVAISLGGHLQVLFGVLGQRWREQESWQTRYINDRWIDMPEHYRPDLSNTSENYW